MRRITWGGALGVLLAMSATGLSAQVTLEHHLRAIDALYAAGDCFGPGRELSAALAANPRQYALLWRAARDGVMISLARSERHEVDRALERATEFGRQAVAANPRGRDGQYWLAAALGRRAQRTAFAESARYAREAYTLGDALLKADSLDAGAHALIGRLQVELLKLPGPIRWIVTLGLPANQITWTGADRHLQRAIALDPTSVGYRVDRVQWLMRRGDLERAERETRALVALPVRTPADTFFQRDIAGKVEGARRAATVPRR